MNDERELTSSPKRHRLARSSALAVVLMALCAPLAGAAGIQLPQAPPAPSAPQAPLPVQDDPLPELPALPGVEEILPAPPGVETSPIVPDVTTLPVPVEELEGAVDPVVDETTGAVDDLSGGGAGDVIGDVTGGGGPVEEVVDEVTGGGGPVEEVVDDVTGGGAVDEVVDDVTGGGGPVEEVVDDVTGGGGPVEEVVDDVTDPEGPVGEVVDGVVDGVGSAGDQVGEVVDGVVGALPNAPDVPGVDSPGDGGIDTGVTDPTEVGGNRFPDSPEDPAVRAERIAATISPDGFAASVLAATETSASGVAFGPRRDVSGPSLVERIARSISDVAQKIAFPLLLALIVGAFVVVQNRVDRKDPKLALAAIDADEDLLGFE